MKAILEFNLDDFDDTRSHRRCVNATNAYLALCAIEERINQLIDDPGLSAEQCQLMERLSTQFSDILAQYNVYLTEDIS